MHEENQNLLGQFAMAAMQGIISSKYCTPSQTYEQVATSAYRQAEAMMKEREWIMKK